MTLVTQSANRPWVNLARQLACSWQVPKLNSLAATPYFNRVVNRTRVSLARQLLSGWQVPSFKLLLTLLCLLASPQALGHGKVKDESKANPGRQITFPDVDGYKTLVVDLHTHSVFSDGHVWPRIRVSEANRDGLDAMAVTEHLEWQPHLADIPHPDRNRSYETTLEAAEDLDLLIIPGVEITREAPSGHTNAIFVTDANSLFRVEGEAPESARAYYGKAGRWPAREALEAANDQDAFVFWNHPFWTFQNSNGIAEMNDFHRENVKLGLLHGIEVANGRFYSEEAFAIALEYDLTIIGVSDVHELIDWDYPPQEGQHRPVTLVFAEDRSLDGIKDALFAKRTLAWFKNLLLGREEVMAPLLDASLSLEAMGYATGTDVLVLKFTNRSDASFILDNQTDYTFMQAPDMLEVPAHDELMVGVKTGSRVTDIALEFKVINALVAPKQPADISFDLEFEIREIPL